MNIFAQAHSLQRVIAICFFFMAPHATGKVILLSFCYNKPEFIELQYKTFKKFLLDEHELVIINDANKADMFEQITTMCSNLNVRCINIPQEIHDRPYLDRQNGPYILSNYHSANSRNCNVVQYALDTVSVDKDDLIGLFDSDIFLTKPLSICQFLKGYNLAGFNRKDFSGNKKKSFLWIGLIFLRPEDMPLLHGFNVNCGFVHNVVVDSGGYSNYYIENAQANIRYFNRCWASDFICKKCKKNKAYTCDHNQAELEKYGFDQTTIQFIQATPIDWGSGSEKIGMCSGRNIEFYLDNSFVHYQGASNYAPKSALGIDMNLFHKDKTTAFKNYIHKILD